MKGSGFLH